MAAMSSGLCVTGSSFICIIFAIIAITPVNSIRASSCRSNSAMAHEMANYSAYNRTFHAAARPCKNWESWSHECEKA
jgi:hypothetical protein